MSAASEAEKALASADRGLARRQAFLVAARQVFLEQGYEAASVNDVVRLAGGSLATLYAHYRNKEGLFLAVLQDHHERMMQALTPGNLANLDLPGALQVLGEQFLRTILQRDNRAFFRLVVSEGRKFPESAQQYITAGVDKVRHLVAQRIIDAGMDCPDRSEMCASYFLELLRARHHYRSIIDESYALSDQQLSDHVAGAVRFLLRGMKEA